MKHQIIFIAILFLTLTHSFHLINKSPAHDLLVNEDWPPLPPWRCIEGKFDSKVLLDDLNVKTIKGDDCYFDETICLEDGGWEGGYHPMPCKIKQKFNAHIFIALKIMQYIFCA